MICDLNLDHQIEAAQAYDVEARKLGRSLNFSHSGSRESEASSVADGADVQEGNETTSDIRKSADIIGRRLLKGSADGEEVNGAQGYAQRTAQKRIEKPASRLQTRQVPAAAAVAVVSSVSTAPFEAKKREAAAKRAGLLDKGRSQYVGVSW